MTSTRGRFLTAASVAFAVTVAAIAGAQAPRLVRSLAGPSGKIVGAQFVFDETRNRFVYPQDRVLTVYFEWEHTPGDHVLTATWKQPDGRVASVSPDVRIQAPSKQLSCYWIFNIAQGYPSGTWTVEIRIDGQPAGVHAFELAGVDGTNVRFTLDQVSTLYGASVLRVHKLDEAGRRIDTSSGFVLATNTVATAFQSIDTAARVEIEFADGRKVPADGVLALSRLNDWALLRADTGDRVPLPIGDPQPIPVGSRLAAFSVDRGVRVIVPVSVGAVAAPTNFSARIRFSPDVSRDALGGPLIDERGKVVGILGGSLTPGSRLGQRVMEDSPWLWHLRPDGNSATAISDVPAAVPSTVQPLDALAASGVLTPQLNPMSELVSGGTTTQLPKSPADRTFRDRTEFSAKDDGQVTVYSFWLKRAKLSKGELSATLFDQANKIRGDIPPRKISLGSQQQRVAFSWPLHTLTPGYYRIDVRWDGKPVWRTYIHVVD